MIPERREHGLLYIHSRCFRILAFVEEFTREWLCLMHDASLSGAKLLHELDAIVVRRGLLLMYISDSGNG